MFFRRMFSRKDKDKERDRDSSSSPPPSALPKTPASTTTITDTDNRRLSLVQKSPMKRRILTNGGGNLTVVQLTPLWEHIIRSRTLPDDLNPEAMFDEFLERLGDPEWQVRQHALRVLIDVLIVMGQKADSYFAPVIPRLVENLGHPAPTVRKGAMDAIRVYISETAMPETILLEVMDIGLNQRIVNEPFGGRITCGVMLSLPSLVHATLPSPKRSFILRSTIEMLVDKMTQVTHQEVTLKVLIRLRDLIGPREFSEYMSHGAYREFELLCSVYGLGEPEALAGSSRSSWHAIQSFEPDDGDSSSNQADQFWRIEDQDELFKDNVADDDDRYDPDEKVIMETEIKINDDTLTMRILERKDEQLEDENCHAIICSDDEEITGTLENSGIIHVLSDSELEDINNNATDDNDDDFVARTPKRVTFGGEIVKMRTPDSDTTVHSDNEGTNRTPGQRKYENLNFLTVEIPNDNTKPVESPKSMPVSASTSAATTPRTMSPVSPEQSATTPVFQTASPKKVASAPASSPFSPRKSFHGSGPSSLSPRKQYSEDNRARSGAASPFRRISISPVDAIISPKQPHKEIEVLHNLQRSPCISPRASSGRSSPNSREEKADESEIGRAKSSDIKVPPPVALQSWEELGIVDEKVLKDLKSGDWRHRLHAIASIEEVLKSSETLAKIQPCLDTFLRMLLSSERNLEVAEDKRRIVINLISRLPLDNLESRSTQIITGLCRQGGAGSNRVCKSLMQRLPPSFIVLKLLSDEFLHARSSRFRENALQMVMYALMTFPSTCFDTATCINRTIYAALDRKRRVRQASLDVLAVLGQVTSPRMVLDSVQTIAGKREDGKDLSAAVQARLARKQLPVVGPDGSIQYALRVPSPHGSDPLNEISLGADVEWIISGIGSVSPTSLRRRTQQRFTHSSKPLAVHHDRSNERRLKALHEILAVGVGVRAVDDFLTSTSSSSSFQGNSDDTDDSRTSYQYTLATGTSLQYKTNNGSVGSAGDIFGVHGKRIASRSHSNLPTDRRGSNSDDSGATQIIKMPIMSRFPAMDASGVYIDRQSYRNPYEQFNMSQHRNPMTYAKGQQAGKVLKGHYTQAAFHESKFDDVSPRPISHPPPAVYESTTTAFSNQRRFTNVDKFMVASAKPQQSQYPSETVSSQDRSLNTLITNDQQLQNQDDNDILFSKSSLILDRAVSSKSSKHDLEETESFKQIDSIHDNPEMMRPSKETTPIRSIETPNQASVALPTSINDAVTKTPTLSSKSAPPESAQVSTQTEATQSRRESLESHPMSAISRPDSVQSQHQANVAESRPQSVISSTKSNTEKLAASPSKTHQNEDEPSHEGEVVVVDEVDNTMEVITKVKDAKPDLDELIVEEWQGTPTMDNAENCITESRAETPAITTENQDDYIDEALSESAKPIEIVDISEEIVKQCKFKDISENPEAIKAPPKSAPTTPQPTTPTASAIHDIFESPLPLRSASIPSIDHKYPDSSKSSTGKSTPHRNVSIESIPSRHSSMAKSNDSLFESARKLEIDSKSTASTTSSDYPPSHATSLDEPLRAKSHGINIVKTANLPLIRKSKTTLFGRNRRVSPTKQSIKLAQTEVFPQTLTKFDKPKDGLNQALMNLDSTEWETVILGLRSLVRMMRHHPEILDSQMHIVCIQLGKAVRNLRSQVSRGACQAATELFTIRTKFLEQECDDLAGNLLHRTADTNRFLRADAMRALESMCDNLSPVKMINVLSARGAAHLNSTVRTATAKLLNRLVDRLGYDRIFTLNREHRDKMLVMGANLLMEGSLETRSYTKALFRSLAEYVHCGKILKEVVPIRTYRNIEKTLKSIM